MLLAYVTTLNRNTQLIIGSAQLHSVTASPRFPNRMRPTMRKPAMHAGTIPSAWARRMSAQPIRKAMPYLRNGEAIFSPRIFSPLSILPPSQPRRRSIAANSLASAFPSAASMTIITENRYSPAADVLSYKAPALTRVLVGFSLLILSPLLLTKYCVIFYTYEIL